MQMKSDYNYILEKAHILTLEDINIISCFYLPIIGNIAFSLLVFLSSTKETKFSAFKLTKLLNIELDYLESYLETLKTVKLVQVFYGPGEAIVKMIKPLTITNFLRSSLATELKNINSEYFDSLGLSYLDITPTNNKTTQQVITKASKLESTSPITYWHILYDGLLDTKEKQIAFDKQIQYLEKHLEKEFNFENNIGFINLIIDEVYHASEENKLHPASLTFYLEAINRLKLSGALSLYEAINYFASLKPKTPSFQYKKPPKAAGHKIFSKDEILTQIKDLSPDRRQQIEDLLNNERTMQIDDNGDINREISELMKVLDD
ncbi:MAG: hypothetical protein LBV55_04185 [Acholeplasmatales bacterium]|jgi:hypothetical protein|nr:hypothetical protein [Acholeplasmatales bacterium]